MATFLRRRSLLIWTVAVIGALGAGLLLLRWALEPAVLKSAAETRLSAALGQPVAIGTVRVSLLPPLTVYGTDITVGRPGQAGGASLDIHAIGMRPRLSSLFSRPIVIDRVDLEGLVLRVRRDPSGRWVLPFPLGGASGASENPTAARFDVAEIRLRNGRLTITDDQPARGARPAVTPLDNINATVRRTGSVTELDGLTASVGRSKVTGNGSIGGDGLRLNLRWADLQPGDAPFIFALIGSAAPADLSVQGKNPLALDLRAATSGEITASGRVAADRAAFGTLTMTSFQSPAVFAKNRLTFDPMTFRAYSGSGRGRLTVNLGSSPLSWAIDGNLDRVDVDQFVSANTSAKNKVTGTASIRAQLRGTSRQPMTRTVAGTAGISIANGAVHDFPLLAAIYSALRVGASAGRDLPFETLSATFAIADGRAATNDLTARTGELTLTAAGWIGFDQAIQMKGVAAFSAAESDQFVRSVKELGSLRNAQGELEVPFTVSGTTAAPHFSIDVVGMAGRAVQQEIKRRLGDRLKDLFKKKK